MMLRSRKSLHNADDDADLNQYEVYNNNRNTSMQSNQNGNWMARAKNKAQVSTLPPTAAGIYTFMDDFTQSSGETTMSESPTTSAASLLSPHHPHHHHHQLHRFDRQHLKQQRQLHFESNYMQPYAALTRQLQQQQQQKTGKATRSQGLHLQQPTKTFDITGPSTQRRSNFSKLQFPGHISHWNSHPDADHTTATNPAMLHGVPLYPQQWQLQNHHENDLPGMKNSIRRMRRPRQWLPPTLRMQTTSHHDEHATGNGAIGQAALMNVDDLPDHCAKRSYADKGKDFFIEFLQGSSIHGFIYLAKIGLNIIERMLWLTFICIALFAIISLSHRTWERFQTSPMVISMDRNKLVWNTSFPSLTVCPHKRIDEIKVEEYMDEHSDEFKTEEDKEEFREFIAKLAGLTYDNIETLPMNRTFGIPSNQYLDLLYKLKWNFKPEMSSGAAVKMYIYETLTELGICHSVNSLVARYNSYSYWHNNNWQLLDHGDRVTVHPLDGEIYAQIINLSTAYDVYFHGAGDIPSISKQRYTFPESDYTTVELIALEIYTAEEARAFTTKQRKCRYQYEAEEMLTVPIYSFGLCLSECRMFFALKICGCIPHFYRSRLRNGRKLPICGFEGIHCLQTIKRDIISLKSDRFKIDCSCLANCDDSNFFVQTYRSRVWFLGANLQWGIIDYPKMQLRRDVVFSFADVLVYIGGLVGFFLGCSILSFTEILYYFTARFIKRMLSK